MNAASQNLAHHLAILRERMLHPTSYELAVDYFLEEFAGDEGFVKASDPEQMPHVVAVLERVLSDAIGQATQLSGALISRLRQHQFIHGNARAGNRVVIFFYFEESDTGIAMLLPGVRGQMDIARFKITGGLADPRKN